MPLQALGERMLALLLVSVAALCCEWVQRGAENLDAQTRRKESALEEFLFLVHRSDGHSDASAVAAIPPAPPEEVFRDQLRRQDWSALFPGVRVVVSENGELPLVRLRPRVARGAER